MHAIITYASYEPGSTTNHLLNNTIPDPHHHLSHHLLPAHLQPELRLYELNKRLASRPEQPEAQAEGAWWEAFASEFFDEDATLSVRNVLEHTPCP